MVASFSVEKVTCATQPPKNATFARRSPDGLEWSVPRNRKKNLSSTCGSSISRSASPITRNKPLLRARICNPDRWYQRSRRAKTRFSRDAAEACGKAKLRAEPRQEWPL